MTKEQALPFAQEMYAAYRSVDTDFIFGRGVEPIEADYCHKHGWIIFAGHSFNSEMLTSVPYDITQGGLAFV